MVGTAAQSVQALASSLGALPPEFVRPEHEQPRATTFRGAAPPEIPVINMSSPGAWRRMAEAAAEWGIFQVVGHGVPADAVAALQRVGRGFFALPQEEKQRYAMDPAEGKTEGYGSSFQRSPGDRKIWSDNLFHTISPPAAVNHGFWPEKPRGYREANEAYCGHMRRLTREVLERGLAPHTDMSTLTVLLSDEVQGLQVFKDGCWYDVNYVPGALIIHIGDQIEASASNLQRRINYFTFDMC